MLSEQNFSFATKILTSTKDSVNFEELSNEQLKLTLDEAIRTNRTLVFENEILEHHLQNKYPQALKKMAQILESIIQAQNIADRSSQTPRLYSFSTLSGMGGTSTYSSPSIASHQLSMGTGAAPRRNHMSVKITLAHRIQLIEKELDDVKRQYSNLESETIKSRTDTEARLKEMKFRLLEVEEMSAHFEKDIINQADPITKLITQKQFLRFMEEQFKVTGHLLDKFNLNMVTTKRLIKETKSQILQHEERGESLGSIDFIKLEIENRYLHAENEKNHQILTVLKQRNGYFNLMLKNHKEKLIEKKAKLKRIDNTLLLKKRESTEMRHLRIRTSLELKEKVGRLERINYLMEKYETPNFEDFLNVQKQLLDVKNSIKRLQRQRKLQLFKKRAN